MVSCISMHICPVSYATPMHIYLIAYARFVHFYPASFVSITIDPVPDVIFTGVCIYPMSYVISMRVYSASMTCLCT